MTEPGITPVRKTTAYWIGTLFAWAMVVFLVSMAIWSLAQGNIGNSIAFLFFATCFLLAMFQPKWLQRFASWRTNDRKP